MDILFLSTKFEKECNNHTKLVRKHGQRRAELLELRLTQLRAAGSLEELRLLPQIRCHELTGNLKGKLALDLEQPYRLIIEPANTPLPRKPDGGLDWAHVTKVTIIDVKDYHG